MLALNSQSTNLINIVAVRQTGVEDRPGFGPVEERSGGYLYDFFRIKQSFCLSHAKLGGALEVFSSRVQKHLPEKEGKAVYLRGKGSS